MNIFYLHENYETAAKQHLDKHVVKMIIEYAQLMSTAHRVIDGTQWYDKTSSGRKIARWEHPNPEQDQILYKASHVNHPSGIWARESHSNYMWLHSLWQELCKEYTYRYGKVHLTQQKLQHILNKPPEGIKSGPMTKMPQAMPDEFKQSDSIEAYRQYYRIAKAKMAVWTKRDTPDWYYAA
jgi:hypothetical protein